MDPAQVVPLARSVNAEGLAAVLAAVFFLFVLSMGGLLALTYKMLIERLVRGDGNGKASLESLQRDVREGHQRDEERAAAVEAQFREVTAQVASLGVTVEANRDERQEQLAAVDERLSRVEETGERTAAEVHAVRHDVQDLRERVGSLEGRPPCMRPGQPGHAGGGPWPEGPEGDDE